MLASEHIGGWSRATEFPCFDLFFIWPWPCVWLTLTLCMLGHDIVYAWPWPCVWLTLCMIDLVYPWPCVWLTLTLCMLHCDLVYDWPWSCVWFTLTLCMIDLDLVYDSPWPCVCFQDEVELLAECRQELAQRTSSVEQATETVRQGMIYVIYIPACQSSEYLPEFFEETKYQI